MAAIGAAQQAAISCQADCERHAAVYAHCRLCAETCRRAEASCDAALEALR